MSETLKPPQTDAGSGDDEAFESEIEVVNSEGLHARPAHQVAMTSNRFPCQVFIAKGDLEVDAKSIMSLMLLAAEKGSRLRIRAEGSQAEDAVDALVKLFASRFEED